jgi:nucleotide-binding universal stress UspA family protein
MGTAPVRRLLVPLTDGAADVAGLHAIIDLARGAGAVVRLLYVRSLPPDAAPNPSLAPSPAGEETRRQAEATRYLDAVTSTLGDIPVERVMRFGDLETAILDEAAAWRADLVALSAGDRMWLSRAVHSGTAAKAFRETGIPALLYMPGPDGSREPED